MLSAVSELYAAGVALESVEVDFAEGELSKDNVNRVEFWKELSRRFTPHSIYWMVFDPLDDENTEPVAGDLGDDMADIYFDIVPGLKGWQSGESSQRQRAVWSWQFSFRTHWGNHALGALPALHWLVIDRGV